jgi:hypothetical protein
MTKTKKLFTNKNKDNNMHMNVDETLYNHFQSLTPAQQKSIQDSMTLRLLLTSVSLLH